MVLIRKEEFLNHTTNRVGSNFRRLMNEYKLKKYQDGEKIGGKGRLTNETIETIQNNGRTICNNEEDVPKTYVKI